MHFHSLVVHAHIRYTTNVIIRVLPNQYLRRGIVAWHRDMLLCMISSIHDRPTRYIMHSCTGKGAGTAVLKYVARHASHLTLITIKLFTFEYLVSFLESQ